MSRILLLSSGLTGITNASLELVTRLKLAGHTIEYGSNRDLRKKVSQLDIEFYLLDEILEDYGPEVRFKNRLLRFTYKLLSRRHRTSQALKKAEPKKLKLLLEKGNFDLVISDMELHEYIFTAFKYEVPILLLSQWFSNWPQDGLAYLLSDIIPNEQFDHERHWNEIRKERKKLFLRRRLQSGATDRYSLLPLMAIKYGFPQKYIGENFWPGPFLYQELPVISMTAKELEFEHVVRKNMHYVGPMVYTDRVEEVDEELKSRIKLAKEIGHKVIYCSLSTLSKGDAGFVSKLVRAVSTMENVFLLVSLGRAMSDDHLAPSPSVMIRSNLPQLYILRNADLSINHGGIHTINECIAFSVPMLIYSGKRSDQNGCAARVHYHELGIAADKDKDDVKTISSKIHDILTQDKFLKNTKAVHRAYLSYKKEKTVEKIIDKYLFEKDGIK